MDCLNIEEQLDEKTKLLFLKWKKKLKVEIKN